MGNILTNAIEVVQVIELVLYFCIWCVKNEGKREKILILSVNIGM